MMRLPFSNTTVALFISAPGASRSTISSATLHVWNASMCCLHFSTASSDWRSDGDAIRKSRRGVRSQSATARMAPVKLLPIWRPAIQAMKRDGSRYTRSWYVFSSWTGLVISRRSP